MSTYNGGRFLNQQIESIIKQTEPNWDLFIRDDGSTDNTIDIIKSYIATDSRIHLVSDPDIHRGAKNSFFWLLNNTEAEYYMFSDQDDVWDPTKIEVTLNTIKKAEEEKPGVAILACTDLQLVDANLNIIAQSMWKHSKFVPQYQKQWKYLRVCNIVTGCTMMFNEQSKRLGLQGKEYAQMHDSWISMKVVANDGELIPINTPLIQYRQHNSNVLGCPPSDNLKNSIKKIATIRSYLKILKTHYMVANHVRSTTPISFLISKLSFQIKRIFTV